MKISELLDSIRKYDLVLPEFQREYVWTLEQAKQLMVSLVKGYPVGGLLLWKTDQPPELKNLDKLPEKLGTVQVLLDGQQRLTTLHMLTTGAIEKGSIKAICQDRRFAHRGVFPTLCSYLGPIKGKRCRFCAPPTANVPVLKGTKPAELGYVLLNSATFSMY
jgi:hypothetical protein